MSHNSTILLISGTLWYQLHISPAILAIQLNNVTIGSRLHWCDINITNRI
jgi:hypothetical protein